MPHIKAIQNNAGMTTSGALFHLMHESFSRQFYLQSTAWFREDSAYVQAAGERLMA